MMKDLSLDATILTLSKVILALDAAILALVLVISAPGRVSGDCGVGITPQMCNRVTNP